MDSALWTFYCVAGGACAIGLIRHVITLWAWRKLGPGHSASARRRLASNAWYGIYYTWAAVYGASLLRETGWWGHIASVCFHTDEELSPSFNAYHIAQLAFYFDYTYAMLTGIDNQRKDQGVFLVHHVVTVGLIVFSRACGYMPVQLAMLVLHDAADPFLHIAKVCKSLWPEKTVAADLFMTAFACVFFVTRWVLYPMYLIQGCHYAWNVQYPDDWQPFAITEHSLFFAGRYLSYFSIAVVIGMSALQLLHLYWGAYILKMAWYKFVGGPVNGGQGDDPNSEDEDDTDEQQENEPTTADAPSLNHKEYEQVWPKKKKRTGAKTTTTTTNK